MEKLLFECDLDQWDSKVLVRKCLQVTLVKPRNGNIRILD